MSTFYSQFVLKSMAKELVQPLILNKKKILELGCFLGGFSDQLLV